MSDDRARIIIVEDDRDLRESIAEFLTISGYEVITVGDGRSFYRALDSGNFAAAIIDIGLPDQSGLVLADYLRSNTSTGIIILTARDSEEDQVKGYETGADLYLCKPVASRVLVSAVRRLTERLQPQQPGAALPNSGWLLSRQQWQLTGPDGRSVPLTSLEFSFLDCLAGSSDRQATREAIVAQVYRHNDEYTGRALDALVRRLRKKMACVPETSNPIRSVYAVGYRFSDPLNVL
jgi:two-component system, OmpR family, response regulator